jgi:hypothetical protein
MLDDEVGTKNLKERVGQSVMVNHVLSLVLQDSIEENEEFATHIQSKRSRELCKKCSPSAIGESVAGLSGNSLDACEA